MPRPPRAGKSRRCRRRRGGRLHVHELRRARGGAQVRAVRAKSRQAEEGGPFPFLPSSAQTRHIEARLTPGAQADARGKVKSKAELAAEAVRARDVALQTQIGSSNRGFRMLSKLGYTPGMALGKTHPGAAEPLRVAGSRSGRGGVGLDGGERKRRPARRGRRARRSGPATTRTGSAGGRRRRRGRAAGRGPAGGGAGRGGAVRGRRGRGAGAAGERGLALARPVRERMLRDRARAERDAEKFRRDNEMQISNGRRPVYLADESEDEDDLLAYGKGTEVPGDVDELDAPDPELEAFVAVPGEERLAAVVRTLREQWHYCFWCKSTYPTAEMEGCPGPLEEDHE